MATLNRPLTAPTTLWPRTDDEPLWGYDLPSDNDSVVSISTPPPWSRPPPSYHPYTPHTMPPLSANDSPPPLRRPRRRYAGSPPPPIASYHRRYMYYDGIVHGEEWYDRQEEWYDPLVFPVLPPVGPLLPPRLVRPMVPPPHLLVPEALSSHGELGLPRHQPRWPDADDLRTIHPAALGLHDVDDADSMSVSSLGDEDESFLNAPLWNDDDDEEYDAIHEEHSQLVAECRLGGWLEELSRFCRRRFATENALVVEDDGSATFAREMATLKVLERKDDKDPSHHFVCPITHELMKHPVIDREGFSYEQSAILEWLRHNKTSPITRNRLQLSDLAPNRALRAAIEALLL